MRFRTHAIVLPVLAGLFAGALPAARADAILDLRQKIVDFSTAQAKKRWAVEDRMIQRERQFQDGLREEYREVALKGLRHIKDGANWKAAKRAYNERMRAETALLRQKTRVHRDEFDLTLLATSNELEREIREFLAPLEQRFRENRDEAFRKAQDDFEDSREELREGFRDWKERAKQLKTASDFSPK